MRAGLSLTNRTGNQRDKQQIGGQNDGASSQGKENDQPDGIASGLFLVTKEIHTD